MQMLTVFHHLNWLFIFRYIWQVQLAFLGRVDRFITCSNSLIIETQTMAIALEL